ncbi:hypothetical protein BIW11_09704 [Tropilaelaps mercedesae]|uniref:Uncharacterized protein n=1 Tax=Tropilaelaps mercedesae TaxID=418985 RepID=A0A1V9XJE5_9ACAR|nr:hypothetical protein BIW11_09704 [Tropilaelaps mercedesae]
MDAALYTICLVPPLALVCGSRCITRLTLLLFCLPPTIIAFKNGQMDTFWSRFWVLVGLASNLCIRGRVRAAFVIWCAMPCAKNGTHVIFELLNLEGLNRQYDPMNWLSTVIHMVTGRYGILLN